MPHVRKLMKLLDKSGWQPEGIKIISYWDLIAMRPAERGEICAEQDVLVYGLPDQHHVLWTLEELEYRLGKKDKVVEVAGQVDSPLSPSIRADVFK